MVPTAPLPPPVPPTAASQRDPVATFVKYTQKSVGVDMALKTVCYVFRLYGLRSPAHQQLSEPIVSSIIECRMLGNIWKHFGTARQILPAIEAGGATGYAGLALINGLSVLMRTWEQTASDAGVLQRYIIQSWSRQRLSKAYKFAKSISLTCVAVVELCRMLIHTSNNRRGGRRLGGAGEDVQPRSRNASCEGRRREDVADVPTVGCTAGSPHSHSPMVGSTPVIDDRRRQHSTCAGSDEFAFPLAAQPPSSARSSRLVAAAGSGPSAVVDEDGGDAAAAAVKRAAFVKAALIFIRAVADMVVYYQWVDSYRPPKGLEYTCGLVSGALGVYLVASDL